MLLFAFHMKNWKPAKSVKVFIYVGMHGRLNIELWEIVMFEFERTFNFLFRYGLFIYFSKLGNFGTLQRGVMFEGSFTTDLFT